MSGRRNEESGKDYEVGYARPPKLSQFQKGQSGNPGGRQKNKAKPASIPESIDLLIARESARIVRGIENGKQFEGPAIQVVIRQLFNKALKGDAAAMKLAMQYHDSSVTNNPVMPDNEALEKMSVEELTRAYRKFVASTTPTRR